MSKILEVDFKKKQLLFTYEDALNAQRLDKIDLLEEQLDTVIVTLGQVTGNGPFLKKWRAMAMETIGSLKRALEKK